MTELVSVVIPARNAEKLIGKTIQSVLNQSDPNLELTVVDDGSTDSTVDEVKAFDDSRLRLISQPAQGVAFAHNTGLASSRGRFICFLDADDKWDRTKLATQINWMDTTADCAAVGCLMRYESIIGRALGVAGQTIREEDIDRIAKGKLMPAPLSSFMFDRAAVLGVGGFDTTIPLAHDLDLLSKLSRQGRVIVIDDCLGSYVIHRSSITARQFRLQRAATRFIRERIRRRERGGDLEFAEFIEKYTPTLSQRYGDAVQVSYRRTGPNVAPLEAPRGVSRL